MVQVYRCNENGSTDKVADNNVFTSNERIQKTVQTSQANKTQSLHGVNVATDDEGNILRGPDSLIGRNMKEVSQLSYSDMFQVMRNDQKIKEILNKSLLLGVDAISHLTSLDKIEIDKAREANDLLIAQKVEYYNKLNSSKKDPLFQ